MDRDRKPFLTATVYRQVTPGVSESNPGLQGMQLALWLHTRVALLSPQTSRFLMTGHDLLITQDCLQSHVSVTADNTPVCDPVAGPLSSGPTPRGWTDTPIFEVT